MEQAHFQGSLYCLGCAFMAGPTGLRSGKWSSFAGKGVWLVWGASVEYPRPVSKALVEVSNHESMYALKKRRRRRRSRRRRRRSRRGRRSSSSLTLQWHIISIPSLSVLFFSIRVISHHEKWIQTVLCFQTLDIIWITSKKISWSLPLLIEK